MPDNRNVCPKCGSIYGEDYAPTCDCPMDKNKAELKECPFCGEDEAIMDDFEMVQDGEAVKFESIRCGYCGITFFTDDKKDLMIEAWNTRKTS